MPLLAPAHGGLARAEIVRMTTPGSVVSVVPANQASWDDLQTVFGTRGPATSCQCQRYKLRPRESFAAFPAEERAERLRQQTDCGRPEPSTTSGLVAYLDSEPVGWCAVEPRTAYGGLVRNNRVPWEGRAEDKTDDSVWAVTCFVHRARASGSAASAGRSRAPRWTSPESAAPAPSRATPCTTKNVILEELHVGTDRRLRDARIHRGQSADSATRRAAHRLLTELDADLSYPRSWALEDMPTARDERHRGPGAVIPRAPPPRLDGRGTLRRRSGARPSWSPGTASSGTGRGRRSSPARWPAGGRRA